jgi:hypothetical protein
LERAARGCSISDASRPGCEPPHGDEARLDLDLIAREGECIEVTGG